jgi:hypothetical protein
MARSETAPFAGLLVRAAVAYVVNPLERRDDLLVVGHDDDGRVVLQGDLVDDAHHGNIRLTAGVDRVLRWFVVTPDMHRVHLSVEDDQTNSSFGFNLTWWDRLFGTYRARPRAVHDAIVIGIHGHTDPLEVARADCMLLMPYKGQVEGYAIRD